jgi:hypothetical protein
MLGQRRREQATAADIPKRKRVVLPNPDERLATLNEARGSDPARRWPQPRADIPQNHRSIGTRGRECPALGAEGQPVHEIGMADQRRTERLTGNDIPQANAVIDAARSQDDSVRAEG